MDNNRYLEKKSALISEEIKNYKPTLYQRIDFSKIPFDLNNLDHINSDGYWHPSQTDKEYMNEEEFQKALDEYKKFISELYFDNVKVIYDSFDGEYSTGASYPYEIIVKDGEKEHTITIDGDDRLIFDYNNKSEITINGLNKFTYADFIRFCELCGIKLKSKYII